MINPLKQLNFANFRAFSLLGKAAIGFGIFAVLGSLIIQYYKKYQRAAQDQALQNQKAAQEQALQNKITDITTSINNDGRETIYDKITLCAAEHQLYIKQILEKFDTNTLNTLLEKLLSDHTYSQYMPMLLSATALVIQEKVTDLAQSDNWENVMLNLIKMYKSSPEVQQEFHTKFLNVAGIELLKQRKAEVILGHLGSLSTEHFVLLPCILGLHRDISPNPNLTHILQSINDTNRLEDFIRISKQIIDNTAPQDIIHFYAIFTYAASVACQVKEVDIVQTQNPDLYDEVLVAYIMENKLTGHAAKAYLEMRNDKRIPNDILRPEVSEWVNQNDDMKEGVHLWFTLISKMNSPHLFSKIERCAGEGINLPI